MSEPLIPLTGQAHAPSAQNSIRMVRLLGTVSLMCGLLIVGTNLVTKERIRSNQEKIMRESVSELLPGVQKEVIYGIEPSGELKILSGLGGEGKRFFAGYDAGGTLTGVVIEASERGYADVISALYSYSPATQTITGFKVVDMRETPGLGDRVRSDPKFGENFKALDARTDGGKEVHPITTVKHGTKKNAWEIDAISGATISSRAVGRMLQKSVEDVTPVILKNLDRIERGN
jgi:Na+-translocating ferredoxin:NAD+ oxidoreductase subunit G